MIYTYQRNKKIELICIAEIILTTFDLIEWFVWQTKWIEFCFHLFSLLFMVNGMTYCFYTIPIAMRLFLVINFYGCVPFFSELAIQFIHISDPCIGVIKWFDVSSHVIYDLFDSFFFCGFLSPSQNTNDKNSLHAPPFLFPASIERWSILVFFFHRIFFYFHIYYGFIIKLYFVSI